jgi:hypothetical protein
VARDDDFLALFGEIEQFAEFVLRLEGANLSHLIAFKLDDS